MIETGNDLKNWRKKNHLTQQQVADFSGYSKYRISHIETENARISKRLRTIILQEDKKLNPQKPLLLKALENLIEYNEDRNHSFYKQLSLLDNKFTTIFNNIPKGFEKTNDYLSLLNTWCSTFITLINTPYTDQTDYNNNTQNTLINFRKHTREYVKKYGNGKEK